MKIAVFGTGMVGQTIGSALIKSGHQVMMGSRTPNNEKAAAWVSASGDMASQGTFAQAAAFGELAFNCTSGFASMDVLKAAGADNLKGKVIVDISNPLDFSKGFPPTLFVSNTTSLGEQLQDAFPESHFVKTLNTLNANLMVKPDDLNNGDHTIFMSGNNADAKTEVKGLLNGFGWKTENVIDLGDITTARGTEQLLPLWVRLYGSFGTPSFQFKVVK